MVGCRLALALVILAALVGCRAAPIETDYGPDRTQYLIGFSTSYSYEDDTSETERIRLASNVGYFPERQHEFGFSAAGEWLNAELASTDSFLVGIIPFYNYNYYLANSRTSLFIGPQLGFGVIDRGARQGTDGLLRYGFQGGARHWITDNVALELKPQYTVDKYEGVGTKVKIFQLTFGVSFTY